MEISTNDLENDFKQTVQVYGFSEVSADESGISELARPAGRVIDHGGGELTYVTESAEQDDRS